MRILIVGIGFVALGCFVGIQVNAYTPLIAGLSVGLWIIGTEDTGI